MKNKYTFVILELDHSTDRAEYLLPHNLHVGMDAGEKCWLDKEAFCSFLIPSAVHSCTIIFTGFDIAHDALPLFYQEKFDIQLE
jgi:hypothetical protein